MTLDPVAGPKHPHIVSDEDEKAMREGEKSADEVGAQNAATSPSEPAATPQVGQSTGRPTLSSK